MPQNFIDSQVGQPFLLPPDPQEWLPEDHLAFFVRDALAQVDLGGVYDRYRANGQGRAAYDPAVMLAVLVYGHAVGVRSSRGIERRCVEDVAFRVLCGNAGPDHATIARFFTRHREQFEVLFVQVLVLCRQLGMLRLGEVAIDGTKVKANASWSSGQSAAALEHQVGEAQAEFEELAQVVAEVAAEHAGNDAAEDAAFGSARGDELPVGLRRRSERLERMKRARELAKRRQEEADTKLTGAQAAWDARAAKAAKAAAKAAATADQAAPAQAAPAQAAPDQAAPDQAERRGQGGRGKPGPKPGVLGPRPSEDVKRRPRVSVTDPDSARMKDKTGFVQGFNAQAAVTGDQIIVGVLVSANPTDHHLLHPVVAATRAALTGAGDR